MSPRLALHFLGIPQLNLDSTPITTDRRKAVALLAYLAASQGKYTREFLSGLLWPDYDQAKAFSNLRRTIWEVHQAIGENWLIAERESVRLDWSREIDLDVAQFQDLLSQAQQQLDISSRIPLLFDAVKLYRNHFLTGFSLKDAFPFNEWAYAESEELRRQLASALNILSQDYCRLGQGEKAIPYARRLITLDPLNEAAHRQLMEVYLQAGQHSAAMKQYQTCEQVLRKELNLDPQPETRALYKKIRTGEIKPVQAEKQIENIPPKHNLPSQLSTFIGREAEKEEIINLISKNRLVTLAGIGGIGKTRLALQVGQRLLNDYPHGLWFSPLDSLSDPALVPQTVASVFEIREAPNRPVIEILMHVIREKTTLIILDNCEHLLDSCAQLITTLLTHCPNLKILATSREILSMKGEATYYLPSLSLPEENNLLAEKLTEYEAVQLFAERAALALSSFRLTNENAQTVVDICRRVDGIPLAIELAAARVNILQVEEILKQLQNSFGLLSSDGRIILPRQQTLKASMDWSWSLLSEAEQTFMQELAVFAGGWTVESAQTVCDGDVLGLLRELVNKSLIVVDQKTSRETRYRFHEIVRQYARERLVESDEEANICTRHLKYFLQLSEKAELGLKGHKPIEWYSRLRIERDNIRTALEWANKTDVEAGLYISARLDRYWNRFDIREGALWLGEFVQRSESHFYPLARAKALLEQGWEQSVLQNFGLAYSAAQECLELYQACGDKQGEVDALTLLGAILHMEGAPGMEVLQRALFLSQSLNDSWRQAMVLDRMSFAGQSDERRISDCKKAILLYRKVGDFQSVAGCLGWLGKLQALNGELDAAQQSLEEMMLLNRQFNKNQINPPSANAVVGLSRIEALKGNFEKGRLLLEERLSIDEEMGYRMSYLWNRAQLGHLLSHQGEIIQARDILDKTAQEFYRDKSEIGVVFTLEGISGLFVVGGQPKRAARLIGWADATRKKVGDKRPLLEQADADKIIAACIIKLGEAAFSDAYDEGQKMSMEQAVSLALNKH